MAKKKKLYEVLDIDEKATKEQIKKAYRKQAAKNHPDKGGSHETMALIIKAYKTLSDDDKRAYYDSTEQELPEFEGHVRRCLLDFCTAALNKTNTENAVKKAKSLLKDGLKELEKQLGISQDAVKQLEKRKTKITSKKPENIFHQILDHEIAQHTCRIANLEVDRKVLRAALEELDNYSSIEEIEWSKPDYKVTYFPSVLFEATGS